MRSLQLWSFVFPRCFFFCFVGVSASYFGLKAIFDRSPVGPPFIAFYHILAYWDANPLEYIAVVCLCYGLLSASWAVFFGQAKTWSRALQISGVLIASIYLSSFACGMLWSLHDMQAGYFPLRIMDKMWTDGENGLRLGPLMVMNSFPLNLIALVLGYITTGGVAACVIRKKSTMQ